MQFFFFFSSIVYFLLNHLSFKLFFTFIFLNMYLNIQLSFAFQRSPTDLSLLDEFALRLLCLKSVGQFAAQLRPRPGLQYDLNSDLYSSLLAKPQYE